MSSDPDEEIREAPSDPDEETQKAPSDSEEKTTNYLAGMQQGQRILKGWSYPRVGSSPSVAIFHQIMSSRTWSRRGHAGVEGAAPQSILPTIEEFDEKVDGESTSIWDGRGSMILQRKVEVPEPIARGMPSEQ